MLAPCGLSSKPGVAVLRSLCVFTSRLIRVLFLHCIPSCQILSFPFSVETHATQLALPIARRSWPSTGSLMYFQLVCTVHRIKTAGCMFLLLPLVCRSEWDEWFKSQSLQLRGTVNAVSGTLKDACKIIQVHLSDRVSRCKHR